MPGIMCRGLTRLRSPADTQWIFLSLSYKTWEESENLCFFLCCVFDFSNALCMRVVHLSLSICHCLSVSCASLYENYCLFVRCLNGLITMLHWLSDSGKSVSWFCCYLVHIVARLKNYSGRRHFMRWYNDVRYTSRWVDIKLSPSSSCLPEHSMYGCLHCSEACANKFSVTSCIG